jgi:hypothetical protein
MNLQLELWLEIIYSILYIMEINYKKKFIKYKIKYLNLKNSLIQKGGNSYIIIPNNGQPDGIATLSNQCLWISVRDYLNYARGMTNLKIVEDLKKPFGLVDEKYNNLEFNLEDSEMAKAVNNLAKFFSITLCFIAVDKPTQTIQPYAIENDGRLRCIQGLINPGQKEVVHIASDGGHFSLMIAGPGFNVTKHPKSTITTITEAQAIDKIKTDLPKCKSLTDIIKLLLNLGAGPSNCYGSSVLSLNKIIKKVDDWKKMNPAEKEKAISTGSVGQNIPLGPFYVLSALGVRAKVAELIKAQNL